MIGKTNAQTSEGGGIKGEKVNISLKTNQSSHDDLKGAIITVSYATVVEEYTWNGYTITVEIPPYVDYSVYTSGVEGYATPSSYSSTSVPENSKSVDLEYKAEVVSVTLSTDDGSSVKGASVTINGKTYTWNGTAITQKIAFGTSYTVSVGELSGFSTPAAKSFKAEQAVREVSFTYIASALKVNILSNQSTDSSWDPTITNIKATVSYDGASVEVSNGEQINLPSGVDVTISFPDVEGYLKPNDITFTHNGGLVEKSGTYKCELLTVNVSADQGSVSGFEVTIGKLQSVGVSTKYTKLEYIESTGTQWIDTGVIGKSGIKVIADMALTKGGNSIPFGCYGPDRCYLINVTEENLLRYGYIDWYSSAKSLNVGERYIIESDFAVGSQSMKVNGETIITSANGASFNNNRNIYAFAYNDAGNIGDYANLKMFSLKMYEEGVLVRDYIPALRADGISGLYDSVNDTFYPSNGGGNFVAGNEYSEVIATQTSVTGSYKIPFDVSYTVQTSNVGGYDTPASQTFTADAVSRNVSVVYEAVKDEVLIVNVSSNDGGDIDGMNVFVEGIDVVNDGVYIQDTNGVLWNISDFDGSATPNGIAVINGEHRFVLALHDAYDVTFNWSASAINIDNIVETTSKDVAVADFNGQNNTDKILKQIGKTQALSANYCRRYVFPNGMTGYLGALGEWNIIVQNKSEIDRALTKCGGSSMSYWYHTSTEYAYNAIWAVNWNAASIDFIGKTGFVSRTRALSPLVVQKAVSGGNVTYTIPSGVTYKVSVSGIDGYATPASQIFTAIGGVRTISMQYVHHGGTKKPSNGIYIQDTDGFCHEVNEWSGIHTPNGVAVITDNCAFVVSLKYVSSGSRWGGYKKTISDIITESSASLATLDYLGLFNTDVINSQLNGYNDGYVTGAPAAALCKSFVFPDGSVGYLGAAGEWKAILDNYGSINTAFSKCGAEELSGSNWTSTQYNSEYSWDAVFGYYEISKTSKTNAIKVRAFAVI